MTEMTYKILCIDDEVDMLKLLASIIEDAGYVALLAQNEAEALSQLEKNDRETILVLSDLRMAGSDGLKIRQRLIPKYPDIPFAILSGYVDRELALKGMEYDICAFLEKPIEEQNLLQVIRDKTKMRVSAIVERITLEKSFIEESLGILDELEPLLLNLESDPENQDTINTIFRYIHTIKGASGVMERDEITKFLHSFEDLLTRIKSREVGATPAVVNVLLKGYDIVIKVIQSLDHQTEMPFDLAKLTSIFDVQQGVVQITHGDTGVSGGAASAAADVKSTKAESILVPATMLDEFMTKSGEITVIRNMVNKLVVSIEKKLVRDDDVHFLGEMLDEMHKINGTMQNQITELRKIPMSSVFRKIPRLVRDLAKDLGKSVKVELEGDKQRVDAAIAQAMNNCLVHMIRNSLDHGIEDPATRKTRGKPAEGFLHLKCWEERDDVLITLQDDGKGIDPEVIREKLVSKGLVTQEAAAAMSAKTLLHQIFLPGFSTAAVITDVSGRGVGMDMVMSTITEMRGKIEIDSKVGVGTKFTFRLPIPKSVTIINSLIVKIQDQCFAIPQDSIVRLLRIEAERWSQDALDMQGTMVFKLDGHLVPLVYLSTVLEKPGDSNPKDEHNIVIIQSEYGRMALVVDEILDAEDIVVKSLHKSISDIGVYSGATFLGDGSVGLILDINRLAQRVNPGVLTYPATSDGNAELGEGLNASVSEVLLFELHNDELYGIPLTQISRLDEFNPTSLKFSGGQSVLIYRETIMPVIDVASVLGLNPETSVIESGIEKHPLLIIEANHQFYGLKIHKILDVVPHTESFDRNDRESGGVTDVAIVQGRTTTIIDAFEVLASAGFKLKRKEEKSSEHAVMELTKVDVQNVTEEQQMGEGSIAAGWGMF